MLPFCKKDVKVTVIRTSIFLGHKDDEMEEACQISQLIRASREHEKRTSPPLLG